MTVSSCVFVFLTGAPASAISSSEFPCAIAPLPETKESRYCLIASSCDFAISRCTRCGSEQILQSNHNNLDLLSNKSLEPHLIQEVDERIQCHVVPFLAFCLSPPLLHALPVVLLTKQPLQFIKWNGSKLLNSSKIMCPVLCHVINLVLSAQIAYSEC